MVSKAAGPCKLETVSWNGFLGGDRVYGINFYGYASLLFIWAKGHCKDCHINQYRRLGGSELSLFLDYRMEEGKDQDAFPEGVYRINICFV